MLLVLVISGAWSFFGDTDAPIRTLPLTFAFLTLTGFGLIRRSPPWTLLGLFFGAIGVNVASRTVIDFVAQAEAIAQVSLVASVFFGAIALLISARPYLSEPTLRTRARVLLSSTFIFILTAVLLDALLVTMSSQPALVLAAQLLGLTSVLLLLVAAANTIAALVERERTSDAILLAGLGLYLCVHIPAMLLGSVPLISTAFTIFLTFALVAMTVPGAGRLGLPLDDEAPFFAVRLWPIVSGAVAMGLAHTAVIADLSDQELNGRTVLLGVIVVIAVLFALREAGGPKKPLVIPFSSRDRALQRLPKVLVNGEVRLLGQPVHRTADANVVGIEASPAWPMNSDSERSIEETAADAGLEPELDSVTLRLAQEHLPAVLSVIDADEPWLSVPLRENTEAANRLTEFGEVDGLVLRVPNAEVGKAVEAVRDHGAQLQVPAHHEGDCDPEIVADHYRKAGPERRNATSALLIGRVSQNSNKTEVNLVVDDSTPPTNLGSILGTVDSFGDIADVVRVSQQDDDED